MFLRVDAFKGIIIIPTTAKTEAGYYLDVEPVEVANSADFLAIREALGRAISRGNPLVSTPTRDSFPNPVVLKYAGVKSVSTYEKHLRSCSVKITETDFVITPLRPRQDSGFEANSERTEIVSANAGIEGLTRKVIELVT